MLSSRVDLLHDEALDDISDLDIVEFFNLHAAFVAARDLFDVIFEAAERGKLTLVDNDVVPQDTDLAAALDLAVGAVAAADGAELVELVGIAQFGMADVGLL